MKIQLYDNILRYLVESSSRDDIKHLVELDANGGLGKCSCEHFSIRVQSKIDAGEKWTEEMRCIHIRAARRFFTDLIIKKLSQDEAKKKILHKADLQEETN